MWMMKWLFSVVLSMLLQGSTDTVSYTTQGINDPVTAALHVIVGESCCRLYLVWVPGLRIYRLHPLAGCRKRRLNQAPLNLCGLI